MEWENWRWVIWEGTGDVRRVVPVIELRRVSSGVLVAAATRLGEKVELDMAVTFDDDLKYHYVFTAASRPHECDAPKEPLVHAPFGPRADALASHSQRTYIVIADGYLLNSEPTTNWE